MNAVERCNCDPYVLSFGQSECRHCWQPHDRQHLATCPHASATAQSNCQKCAIRHFPQAFTFRLPSRGLEMKWAVPEAMVAIMALQLWPVDLDLANIADWIENHVEVDAAHLAHVDMGLPVIVLLLDDGAVVLDGNHRLARALQEGRRTFPAFFLTEDQIRPFEVRTLSEEERCSRRW